MYGFFAIINSKIFAISDLLANFDDLCKNKAYKPIEISKEGGIIGLNFTNFQSFMKQSLNRLFKNFRNFENWLSCTCFSLAVA